MTPSTLLEALDPAAARWLEVVSFAVVQSSLLFLAVLLITRVLREVRK